MTREDVIQLAVDAGFTLHTPIEHISKFKRLIELAVQKAVAEEREACALVCERIDIKYDGEDVQANWCASAIRARKDNT